MILLIAVGLVGLAIVLLVLSLSWGAGKVTGVARSLELVNFRPTTEDVARSELGARDRLVDPVLARTRALGRRLAPAGTADRLAGLLDKAGNPPAWTVERLFGAKGALLVGLGLLGLLFGGLSARGLMLAAAAGTLGFFLPDILIYNTGLKRQEELRRGLADALDMLTVCVEAGLGFDSALLQVARSVKGPIAGEFARVLAEIQIGKPRGDAFVSLGKRSTAPEVKNFVSALVQSDRLGLPVANVLREQTANMRLVRRQRAEEQAQKVTVKILFPLIFCILPALFIVIIGPGAIRIYAIFTSGSL